MNESRTPQEIIDDWTPSYVYTSEEIGQVSEELKEAWLKHLEEPRTDIGFLSWLKRVQRKARSNSEKANRVMYLYYDSLDWNVSIHSIMRLKKLYAYYSRLAFQEDVKRYWLDATVQMPSVIFSND